MTKYCNICNTELGTPIFKSGSSKSLTTMNKFIDGELVVSFCKNCQHCQTDELTNLEEFYAHDYEINFQSENDDQLFAIIDGVAVYRSEHQANVLMSKIDLSGGKKVLDYGCANAATLKRVVQHNSDINVHLFDVTDKYTNIWDNFPVPTQWSTHQPNPKWKNNMDVVLSFYALEHISDLGHTLSNVRNLLKDGGHFYFLVPNVYENVADFIVADHVNHFSSRSLETLLSSYGFYDIDIDSKIHTAAYVVSARVNKSDEDKAMISASLGYEAELSNICNFWKNIKNKISTFETLEGAEKGVAVYGAGIYGNFIFAGLQNKDRVKYFIDQNVSLIGTKVHGIPVLHPKYLPSDIQNVIVGLNPKIARAAISSIKSNNFQMSRFYFLD